MTEPSAPLPEATHYCRDCTPALAAATERATQAERERDAVFRGFKTALTERDQARAQVAKVRKARKIAGDAADRFRDVLSEVLDLAENPGDDELIRQIRAARGKSGPEPTRWRDFLTGALATLDQIAAMPDPITAALDSPGATEGEAGTSDYLFEDPHAVPAYRLTPASPAAAEPERCPTCRSLNPGVLLLIHDGCGKSWPCPDEWHATPAVPRTTEGTSFRDIPLLKTGDTISITTDENGNLVHWKLA